jgi:hypothetical protein
VTQERNELQAQVDKLRQANADEKQGGTLKMKMLRERLEKSMENAKATAERERAHAVERLETFEKQVRLIRSIVVLWNFSFFLSFFLFFFSFFFLSVWISF